MKSRTKIVIALVVFLTMFVGGSLFMYYKYVDNNLQKDYIKGYRTKEDPRRIDSALKAQDPTQK